MDYNAVTAFAYSSASALSCILLLFLAWSSWFDHWKWPLTIAAALQTLWLAVLSLSLSGYSISTDALLMLEGASLLGWNLAFAATLGLLRPAAWPAPLKVALVLAIGISIASSVDIIYTGWSGSLTVFAAFLLLSLLALVSLEQLARNARHSRFIRLLAVSLGLLFLFNIYLYAQGMIHRTIDLVLWQARAALIMAACLIVVSAGLLFRDRIKDNHGLGLSRPVAFYSASLLISSAVIIVLAVGGYYVRTLGGHWNLFVFTLLLFFSLVALSALFLSNRVRAHIQVWLSKHFFQHKYDYRQSWLSAIQALSNIPTQETLYQTIHQVFADIFQATGGAVFIERQQQWQAVFSTDFDNSEDLGRPTLPNSAEFIQIMRDREWVFVPKANHGPLAQWNNTLPNWISQDPHVQLVVPLIAQQQLVAFVTLEKGGLDNDLGWEDLDILKTIGRQLANHILLHARERQLSEARQLDTYHKVSAFIMHDMNNLIAQLALVVRNSERHKHNPAFIDDMISTVGASVVRMKTLMQKFSRQQQVLPSRFAVADAIAESIAQCENDSPVPQLIRIPENWDPDIVADRDRFVQSLQHLIKNAQQATPDFGTVSVTLTTGSNDRVQIQVEDTGAGMSREFVESRLFQPFDSTKNGEGMGIGAYLTRAYLTDLGGSLTVDTRLGFGTTMIVELPVSKLPLEATAA